MLIACIDASCAAGFLDDDFAKVRKGRLDVLPNPAREVFTGWVLEALDLVQIAVVEAFFDRIDAVTIGRATLLDVFIHKTGHRFWEETR